MNKRIIGILICTLLIVSSFVATGAIETNGNLIRKEVEASQRWILEEKCPCCLEEDEKCVLGKETYDRTGDIYNYGDCVRMGEAVGGTDATAFYKIDLGCPSNEIEENSLGIGIYFKDLGWWPGGDGPSVYLYNYETSSWSRFGTDVGDNDQLQWWWRQPISNSNDYLQDGKVFISVYAESDDDTILCKVCVKYICMGECKFELNPSSHDFGKVCLGDPDYFTFTLTNTGGISGSGSVYLSGDAEFSITKGGGSFSLDGGKSRDIEIRFLPGTVDDFSATLYVDGDYPCNYISASLDGEGIPCVEVYITYPEAGYLCIFKRCIYVSFLDTLGVAVVIDTKLCPEATATTEFVDYVEFHIEGPDEDTCTDDSGPPFGCCFKSSLANGFLYRLTATAYYNDKEVDSDTLSPIVYIAI